VSLKTLISPRSGRKSSSEENQRKKRSLWNERPMVYVAAALAAGILIGCHVHSPWAFMAILILLAMLLVAGLFSSRRMRYTTLAMLLLFGHISGYLAMAPLRQKDRFSSGQASVSFRVRRQDGMDINGKPLYLVDNARVDGEKIPGLIRVVSDGPLEPYVVMEGMAQVRVTRVPQNPGGAYLQRGVTRNNRWITLEVGAEDVRQVSAGGSSWLRLWDAAAGGLNGFFLGLREHMTGVLHALMPETEADLMAGMILGGSDAIDQEVYRAFMRGSLLHLLAVSGLPVGFLVALLVFIFKWVPLPRALRAIITVMILLVYMAVCGFSNSVVRATVMMSMGLLLPLVGRRNDPISAAAFAFLLIVILSPLALFDVGFQLSFAAVLGIAMLCEPIREALGRLPKPAADTVAVSASAQAGVFPLTMHYFQRTPLAGFILNPLLVPVTGAAVILGWLTILLGSIWLPMGAGLAFLSALLLRGVIAASVLAARIDTFFHLPFVLSAFGAALCFMLMTFFSRVLQVSGRTRKRLLAGLLCVMLLFGALRTAAVYQRKRITVLDAGQAQCVLVQSGGKNVLVGCGTSYGDGLYPSSLAAALAGFDAQKIDTLILPGAVNRYDGNAAGLLELMSVGRIMAPEADEDVALAAAKNGVPIETLHDGQRIVLDESLVIDVWGGANVLKITCGELTALVCGDKVPQAQYLGADAVIALEAKTDEGFKALLSTARPQAAVFSTNGAGGKSTRITSAGDLESVYTTGESGAVTLEKKDGKIMVGTYLEGERYAAHPSERQ
jgi:ComEC/Rec2-related protein